MSTLEIVSPQPFQVIQRRGVQPLRHPHERADKSNGWAPVEIQARTTLVGEVAIRVFISPIGAEPTGYPGAPGQAGGGGEFKGVVTDGFIRQVVNIPAGGWYALTLIAADAGGASAGARTGPFGIGEVYLVGGQSHATNTSDILKTISDPAGRVTTLDLHTGEWRIGHDPQPSNDICFPSEPVEYWRHVARLMVHNQLSYCGGSIWPPAMNLLQPAIGVPIGMVNVGIGGAPMEVWLPGNAAFDMLVRGAKAAGHFRAVLWQQGESNALNKTPTAAYLAISRAVRRSLAEALGARCYDWILAKSTHYPTDFDDPAAEAAIREAVDIMVREDADVVAGPDTDLLRGPYRAGAGTSRHLTSLGQDAFGVLWFGTLLAHINSSRPTASFL